MPNPDINTSYRSCGLVKVEVWKSYKVPWIGVIIIIIIIIILLLLLMILIIMIILIITIIIIICPGDASNVSFSYLFTVEVWSLSTYLILNFSISITRKGVWLENDWFIKRNMWLDQIIHLIPHKFDQCVHWIYSMSSSNDMFFFPVEYYWIEERNGWFSCHSGLYAMLVSWK